MRTLGWRPPSAGQISRAIARAGAPAGDSVLAGITAAPSSDNVALTVMLDQLALGSCTAQAFAQTFYMALVKAGVTPFVAARLALYFWARFQDGWENEDTGTSIGLIYLAAANLGVPPESAWPYEIDKFAAKPGPECNREAYDSKGKIGINYHPITTTGDTYVADVEKACTDRFGVSFAVNVTEEFCAADALHGTVHAPKPGDKIAGGHAMTIVGHERANERAKVKGSWGAFGDPDLEPGCFWMGYDYLKTARDSWIVLAVPKGVAP